MKRCTTCGTDKPLELFSWRNKANNERQGQCKQCVLNWYFRSTSTPEGKQRWIERRKVTSKTLKERRAKWTREERNKDTDERRKYSRHRPLKRRFYLLQQFNFACQYCGRKAPDAQLQIDHKIPRSKGGTDEISNLTVACRECNIGKSDSLLG